MITSHVVHNVNEASATSFSHIDAGSALTLAYLGVIRETKREVVKMGQGEALVYHYVRGDL